MNCNRYNGLSLISISLSFFTVACTLPHEEPKATNSAAKVTAVAMVLPQRGTIRRMTDQPGQIDAIEAASLYAKLAGYVEKVNVDIGDRVKKGQVLAELLVPEITAEARQKAAMVDQARAEKKDAEATCKVAFAGVGSAEAKLVELQAGIKRAQADVARWKAEFTRIEQLVRERAQTGTLLDETRNKLSSSEASEEEARAHLKAAEADLNEAKAKFDKTTSSVFTAATHIEVARFESEKSQAMLGYTRLIAPFDGIVTQRHVDTGHLTTPGTTGVPLFVLARFDVVRISVGIPEADSAFVNLGDSARVRLPALNNRIVEGKVSRTAWALDQTSRTLRTEIDLPNTGETLRPGQYAYVTIISEEHLAALSVPVTAILKDADKSFCMTIVEGKAKRKEVTTGINDGKRIEIVKGLLPDEKVVDVSSASLVDGQPLEAAQVVDPAGKPKS